MTRWKVEHQRATVRELHALGVPVPARRLVRWCEPTDVALVLGRAQPETDVVDATGVDIVRRISGGGAVLVERNEILWFDVVVPTGDPLWESDVTHAFFWLGDAIARALEFAGIDLVRVHKGGLVTNQALSKICYSGLGPGEVLVGKRKAVGISQRRTREAALFQCSIFRAHRSAEVAARLGLTPHVEDLRKWVGEFPELDIEAFKRSFQKVLAELG